MLNIWNSKNNSENEYKKKQLFNKENIVKNNSIKPYQQNNN